MNRQILFKRISLNRKSLKK